MSLFIYTIEIRNTQYELLHQIPQHRMQNASIAVVVDFHISVNQDVWIVVFV